MALRDLVEGDCGGPSSLIRLTSHFVQDHAFKDEGLHHPFVPQQPFQVPDSEQLVKQFLEESPSCPQTFRMDNLLEEMREIEHNIHPPIPAPGVAQELTGIDTAWANQYLESGRHFNVQHGDEIWNAPDARNLKEIQITKPETHEFGLGPKWAEEYIEHSIDVINNDTDGSDNMEDPNFAYSKFMKFMKQEEQIISESSPASLLAGSSTEQNWVEEFDSKNKGTETQSQNITDNVSPLNELEEEIAVAGSWIGDYTKDYNTSVSENDSYESNIWTNLQNEWDKVFASKDTTTSHPWMSDFETYYDPFKEYTFHDKNPMKDLPNALEEGKKRLEAGDLPSAVLCFEAAVQQDENNPEAWLLLGRTQAENEQDPLAIPALKRCLSLDPANGAALMTLAVSYTNESYQNQACLTLKEWLFKNEKYKHLSSMKSKADQHPKSNVSTILFDEVHSDVKNLFIEAARMNPRDEIDADVQCGLGVLFNLSTEYDKAADCFQAALQIRPDDARLWNRLGATLANGQRSEEAINAYHRALELSPGLIRARCNLGVACINLGAYKEAAEHLLTALNQQAAGRGTQGENIPPRAMSNTIWSTLRLVVSLMHKYQLTDAIENRDLARLNKEFAMM